MKKSIYKSIALSLSLALIIPFLSYKKNAIAAGGWLEQVQKIELGQAHTDMLSESDTTYRYSGDIYCVADVYYVDMDIDGVLSIDFESTSEDYFNSYLQEDNYYLVYSKNNTDKEISTHERKGTYVSARNVYTNHTEITLNKGEYYLLVCRNQWKRELYVDKGYTITLNKKLPHINISSIILSPDKLSLNVGETGTITASITPSNATDQNLIWSSSKTSVATVNGGVVTALSIGKTTITAYSSDKVVSAKATVTVTKAVATPTPAPTATPVPTATPAPTPTPTVDPVPTTTPQPTLSPEEINQFQDSTAKITKLTAKKKSFTVSLGYDNYFDVGFEVSYKLGNGLWMSETTSKKKLTISGLKKKKKYSVRVRPYLKNGDSIYFGKWSATKKTKTK